MSQPSIMLYAGTCPKCHTNLEQPLAPGEGTVLGCRRCNPNIPTGPLPPAVLGYCGCGKPYVTVDAGRRSCPDGHS